MRISSIDNPIPNNYYPNYFSMEHDGGFNLSKINHNTAVDLGQGMDFRLPFGTQFHIMQSDEDADKIIAAFEEAIRLGYHPETVEQDIYQQLNINPADLTWYDKNKISRKVNEIWASHNA